VTLATSVERALASARKQPPDVAPVDVRLGSSGPEGEDVEAERLESAERRHIARGAARPPTLDAAARALGVDPSTLYRKRERYGLR